MANKINRQNVMITVSKDTSLTLQKLKVMEFEKTRRNVTKRDIIKMLLDRYESDEGYRKHVDECISRTKEKVRDRVSVEMTDQDKIRLYHITIDKKSRLHIVLDCLAQVYINGISEGQ